MIQQCYISTPNIRSFPTLNYHPPVFEEEKYKNSKLFKWHGDGTQQLRSNTVRVDGWSRCRTNSRILSPSSTENYLGCKTKHKGSGKTNFCISEYLELGGSAVQWPSPNKLIVLSNQISSLTHFIIQPTKSCAGMREKWDPSPPYNTTLCTLKLLSEFLIRSYSHPRAMIYALNLAEQHGRGN